MDTTRNIKREMRLENEFGNEYQRIAGEGINVKYMAGNIYFFGSEIATLRLFKHFATNRPEYRSRQGWSPNMECYFTVIEYEDIE